MSKQEYREQLGKRLQATIDTFLGPNYLEDLQYFTNNISKETQYRPIYEICFNVAEYVTWLMMSRPVPYPIDLVNPYMPLNKNFPNIPASRWRDIPINEDGMYKLYMVNNKEHHEFVVFILGDDLYILSGYGGWFKPIFAKFNKNEWLNSIYDYISKTTNNKLDSKQALNYYNSIFGLPIEISKRVYKNDVPQLTDNVWFVKVL